MKETLVHHYGVNLNNRWNNVITEAWDKAQNEVRSNAGSDFLDIYRTIPFGDHLHIPVASVHHHFPVLSVFRHVSCIGVRDGGQGGGSCPPPIRAVCRHEFGQRGDIIRAKHKKCLNNTNLGSVTAGKGKN